MECPSCGSTDVTELPSTVESEKIILTEKDVLETIPVEEEVETIEQLVKVMERSVEKIQLPNTGRTRTEYNCNNCGALFVARPEGWVDLKSGWREKMIREGVDPDTVKIR